MKTLEVKPAQWPEFCHRLEDHCRGALIHIQWTAPDGVTKTIADEAPLRHVTWENPTDSCNATVTFETGLQEEKPHRHVITEPIQVHLKGHSGGESYPELQWMAEDGVTSVKFHPGLSLDVIRGLAE